MRRRERHALAAETRIQKVWEHETTSVCAFDDSTKRKTLKYAERIWDFLSLRDLAHLNSAFPAKKSIPSIYHCTKRASFKRNDGKSREEVVYVVENDYIYRRILSDTIFGRLISGMSYEKATSHMSVLKSFIKNPHKIDVWLNIYVNHHSDRGTIEVSIGNIIVLRRDIVRCSKKSIEYKMEAFITLVNFTIIINPKKDKHQLRIQSNGQPVEPNIETNGFIIRFRTDNPINFVPQNNFTSDAFLKEIYKILKDNLNDLVTSVTIAGAERKQ